MTMTTRSQPLSLSFPSLLLLHSSTFCLSRWPHVVGASTEPHGMKS
jgi:hypothetical protein